MGLLDWLLSGDISRRLDALHAQGVNLMATVDDLTAKIEAIGTAVSEERAEVQALLGDLRAQIQLLQDQLGQGQLVSQAQLDGLAADADSIIDRVRAISEPVE